MVGSIRSKERGGGSQLFPEYLHKCELYGTVGHIQKPLFGKGCTLCTPAGLLHRCWCPTHGSS